MQRLLICFLLNLLIWSPFKIDNDIFTTLEMPRSLTFRFYSVHLLQRSLPEPLYVQCLKQPFLPPWSWTDECEQVFSLEQFCTFLCNRQSVRKYSWNNFQYLLVFLFGSTALLQLCWHQRVTNNKFITFFTDPESRFTKFNVSFLRWLQSVFFCYD